MSKAYNRSTYRPPRRSPVTPTRTPPPRKPDNAAAADALTAYKWEPQPEAEALVRELVDAFLRVSPVAQALRDRLYAEAGVRFVDLVDTILVPDGPEVAERLVRAGYRKASTSDDTPHYAHAGGIFPRIETVSDTARQVAVRVESIADFVSVWQTECDFVCGASPLSKLRVAKVEASGAHDFWIVERHGSAGMDFAAGDEAPPADRVLRSEEHTSELQSLAYLVCRLLLE